MESILLELSAWKAFSYDDGEGRNDIFGRTYDESVDKPMGVNGQAQVIAVNGSSVEQDIVIQSAVSVNRVLGERLPRYRSTFP